MSSVSSKKSESDRKSAVPPAPRQCMVCMEESNLKACSRCHAAYYCSTTHQKQHWRTHKATCIPKNIPKAPQASGNTSPEIQKAHTYMARCDGSGCYLLWGMFHTGSEWTVANLCIRLSDGVRGGIRNGFCQGGMTKEVVGTTAASQLRHIEQMIVLCNGLFGISEVPDNFGRERKRQMVVPLSLELARILAKRARDDTPNTPQDSRAPLELFLSLPGKDVSEEESQFRNFVERSAESEAFSPGPLGGENRFSDIVYVLQTIRGEYLSSGGIHEDLDAVLGPKPYKDMPPLPNENSDAAAHTAMFKWIMGKVSSVRSVYVRQEKMCRHMSLWHYLMKEPRCAALLWHCAEGMTSDCYMSPWLRAQVLRTHLDVNGQEYCFFDGPFSPVAGVLERLQPEVERLFGYEEHAV